MLPVEMAGELDPGNPIVITAAIFNDNKEEGQQSSLDLMHKIRARQRRSGQPTRAMGMGRGLGRAMRKVSGVRWIARRG
jgi:hypothetical protein